MSKRIDTFFILNRIFILWHHLKFQIICLGQIRITKLCPNQLIHLHLSFFMLKNKFISILNIITKVIVVFNCLIYSCNTCNYVHYKFLFY